MHAHIKLVHLHMHACTCRLVPGTEKSALTHLHTDMHAQFFVEHMHAALLPGAVGKFLANPHACTFTCMDASIRT